MSLKKQCEIGYWIEGSKGNIDLQASFKDCCPHCGKPVASLQDRCCDNNDPHSALSIEMQQQLLLNWMAVASYKEKSAEFWRCARCVLLAQWLSQSSQKHWLLSKRHLPDRLDLDNVSSLCSRYVIVTAASLSHGAMARSKLAGSLALASDLPASKASALHSGQFATTFDGLCPRKSAADPLLLSLSAGLSVDSTRTGYRTLSLATPLDSRQNHRHLRDRRERIRLAAPHSPNDSLPRSSIRE